MPAAPTLSTTIIAGNTGHIADTNTVHGVIDGIYLATVGGTHTTAVTLAQADSGEIVPVNSASAVVVTVPVLAVGTRIQIHRKGTGAVTLTVSGTTLTLPAGATAAARVQGSVISLLWLTTTSVLVDGDLADGRDAWAYGVYPRVMWATTWPSRASAIPTGYAGPVEYFSIDPAATATPPTDRVTNDLWYRHP